MLVLVNGEYAIIEQIEHEILDEPITVYNFEVEDFHTYHVSEYGVLVHNANYDDLLPEWVDNGLPINKGYDSFKELKSAIGSPGQGNHWHHIVEQSQIQKSGFSPQYIHNTSNIVAIDEAIHQKITGYYNTTTFRFTGGLRVRDWLAGQSYIYQYEFGVNILRRYGVIK